MTPERSKRGAACQRPRRACLFLTFVEDLSWRMKAPHSGINIDNRLVSVGSLG